LREGILQCDGISSFYLHDHLFEYSGKKMVRRGLVARVKLEPWGRGIYPHEETSPKAKSNRLQLLRTCRANFSPLLSLYHDSERKVASILSQIVQGKPLMSLQAKRSNLPDSNEFHTLWAITDSETKRELSQLLFSRRLYISDGHHRYETALIYQQERAQEQSDSFDFSVIASKAKQSLAGKGAFNYVMMELVEFSDPGLLVLPLHRLVCGIAPSILVGLADRLSKFFIVESCALKAGRSGGLGLPIDSCLGIVGLQPSSLVALKRGQDICFELMMPINKSRAYREFGVSTLNHIVLDGVLSEAKDLDVAYTVDVKEAYPQIKESKYQLAFLLSPPRPEMVKAAADAQGRMPRKSTYFYPKLPAGLVINPLD